MKKLVLIALLLIGGFSVNAQTASTVFLTSKTYPLTADQSYVFYSPTPYYWTLQCTWTGDTTKSAKIVTYVSNDGLNFSAYPAGDTLLLNDTTGTKIIGDVTVGVYYKYFKIALLHESDSLGTATLTGNIIKK